MEDHLERDRGDGEMSEDENKLTDIQYSKEQRVSSAHPNKCTGSHTCQWLGQGHHVRGHAEGLVCPENTCAAHATLYLQIEETKQVAMCSEQPSSEVQDLDSRSCRKYLLLS